MAQRALNRNTSFVFKTLRGVVHCLSSCCHDLLKFDNVVWLKKEEAFVSALDLDFYDF